MQHCYSHGPHVEVVGGDDVVGVQVALQPEGVLVPLHALLKAEHRVLELLAVLLVTVDAELDDATTGGCVGAVDGSKVS